MPISEYDLIDPLRNSQAQEPAAPPIAPAWHTIVLVVGIIALSIHSAHRLSAIHGPIDRLATYGFSAAMEAAMLAWVVLGLRLNKTSLRSLLGSFSFNIRSIATDMGFALVFWLCSLMVLGTLGIAWSGVEAAVTHRAQPTHSAQSLTRDPSQQQAVRALSQLAPSNGEEIAAWVLLCLLVGFIEETVFRGYLQRQFIGWARGGVGAGVVCSALVFGGAHAYQGVRNMVLLGLFGAMFGVLALYRRSLRAGMFAHSWQDIIAGLGLALLKAHHLI